MDWIKSLLFDPESIAHLLLLYSFVIAIGVMLGKLKFRGVSLGVALIEGAPCSLDVTTDKAMLTFHMKGSTELYEVSTSESKLIKE